MYHYAGDCPVRYIDPTGAFDDISEDCKNFIKNYEGGFRPNIYDAKDFKNIYEYGKKGDWTIGYGHRLTKAELKSRKFEVGVTKEQAEKMFDADFKDKIQQVNSLLSNSDNLTQNQFDALVDFIYTTGFVDFEGSGLKKIIASYGESISNPAVINTDDFKKKICNEFRLFVPPRSSPVHKGLKARRADEIQMFLYGDYKRDGIPSNIWPSWMINTIIK